MFRRKFHGTFIGFMPEELSEEESGSFLDGAKILFLTPLSGRVLYKPVDWFEVG